MNLAGGADFFRSAARSSGFLRALLKGAYARGGYRLFNRLPARLEERDDARRACFIDVSGLAKNDMGTGIQRVARNLARELTLYLQDEAEVVPVWAEIGSPGYFRAEMKLEGAKAVFSKTSEPLRHKPGDVFLGADHSAMIGLSQGAYLEALQKKGVSLNFICHDILPVRRPEWFMGGDGSVEAAWLARFAPLGRMICVSRAVKRDLENWLEENALTPLHEPDWSHNGYEKADFRREKGEAVRLPPSPYFLTVGTIEPRKGHDQALAAFEELWREGADVKLVFAGRPGWKMAAFCEALKKRPDFGKRFFWFDDCSDAALGVLYENCACALAPSRDEGFGLPVVEALGHGKTALCRDIPVFREIAGDGACWFRGDGPQDLACAVKAWLSGDVKRGSGKEIKIRSWAECAADIWRKCAQPDG